MFDPGKNTTPLPQLIYDANEKPTLDSRPRQRASGFAKVKVGFKVLFNAKLKKAPPVIAKNPKPVFGPDRGPFGLCQPLEGYTSKDPKSIEALHDIHDALHDTSILHPWMNIRYGLTGALKVWSDPLLPFRLHIINWDNLHPISVATPVSPLRESDTTSSNSNSSSPNPSSYPSSFSSAEFITVTPLATNPYHNPTPPPKTPVLRSIRSRIQSRSSGVPSHATPYQFEPNELVGRKLDRMQFKTICYLGSGGTGTVMCVKEVISKTKIALKIVPKKGKHLLHLAILMEERLVGEKVSDSPWFAHLYGTWHDTANLYFAMSMYPTDLDSELEKHRSGLGMVRTQFYMAELVIAINELHKRGIIHRDIKAGNILIDQEGHLVLADFGLAQDFGRIPSAPERIYQPYWPYLEGDNPNCDTEERDPDELVFVTSEYRGSEMEMAPEIHRHGYYSFGVDWWAAAITCFWMLTGRPPWYTSEQDYLEGEDDVKPLYAQIMEDPIPWDTIPAQDATTIDFFERMLAKNPKKRLVAEVEIPEHGFFAGINWPLLEKRLAPPPWIPNFEIGHNYDADDDAEVPEPGRPFSEVEPDDWPAFSFTGERALQVLNTPGVDDDSDSDSDSESEADYSHYPLFDISTDSPPISPSPSFVSLPLSSLSPDNAASSTAALDLKSFDTHDARTLTTSYTYDDLVEGWDVSIVSPPSTKPFSPGHPSRQWLNANDIQKFKNSLCASSTPSLSLSLSLSLDSPAPRFVSSSFSPSSAGSSNSPTSIIGTPVSAFNIAFEDQWITPPRSSSELNAITASNDFQPLAPPSHKDFRDSSTTSNSSSPTAKHEPRTNANVFERISGIKNRASKWIFRRSATAPQPGFR